MVIILQIVIPGLGYGVWSVGWGLNGGLPVGIPLSPSSVVPSSVVQSSVDGHSGVAVSSDGGVGHVGGRVRGVDRFVDVVDSGSYVAVVVVVQGLVDRVVVRRVVDHVVDHVVDSVGGPRVVESLSHGSVPGGCHIHGCTQVWWKPLNFVPGAHGRCFHVPTPVHWKYLVESPRSGQSRPNCSFVHAGGLPDVIPVIQNSVTTTHMTGME